GALRARFVARAAEPNTELRSAIRHDVRPLLGLGTVAAGESRAADPACAGNSARSRRAARLPQAVWAAAWCGIRAGTIAEHGDSRRVWAFLQRAGAERLAERVPGGECADRNVRYPN